VVAAARRAPAPGVRIWLLIAALSVIATLVWPLPLLEADRAWLMAQPWRLWTGPLRHGDPGHLLRDLSGLLGLAALMRGRLQPRQTLALVALGLPLPVIGALVGDPPAAGYYGVSGLVHALCALAVVDLARARPWWALLPGLALASKLAFELSTGTLWFALQSGRPAVWGHLTGAALGLAIAHRALATPAGERQRPSRIRRHSAQRRISPMRSS